MVGSLNCLAQPSNTQPADYLTSPNLLQATAGSWSGTVTGSAGGTSGGPGPAFNPNTNTIIFSYGQATAAQTYAFNQALQSAGLGIGGYDYSWKINNNDNNTGTLTGKFTLKGLSGNALETYSYTYNDKTYGDSENFQLYTGTQWFPKIYSSAQISGFTMEWSGQDSRYWAGYWGPRVRQPDLRLRYIVDVCASSPLSSPECPGYAEAYRTQQCTANPLYDTSCSGYAAAYQTQQCAINPLYDQTCPGYSEALLLLKERQCAADPLSSTDCPGYSKAYLNSQCIKDSLYSKECEGYATAYAIKYIVPLDSAVTSAVNQQLTTIVEVAKADPAKVTVVNSTVDAVLATPSTTSVTSATSVTSVIAPPTPVQQSVATAEKPAEAKKTETEPPKPERKAEAAPTPSRKAAEQRAKEAAQESAKATTLEAQAAAQSVVLGTMGYVPGFAQYQQANIPDTLSKYVTRIYYKPVVDNNLAQRRLSLTNESRWQQIVDSQYIRDKE